MSRRRNGVRARKYPKPYRSGLEHRLHSGPLKNLLYEPKGSHLTYVIPNRTYVPDFVDPNNSKIIYEAKGRFRTFQEAMKYIYVRDSNPEYTIRFIISNPNNRAYPQVKMTMGEFLDKYGFEWATEEDIPDDWRG